MPENYPYPGESQEQFAMRQQENDPAVRRAIAERFPNAMPAELDDVYKAWQEHSHLAQREGEQPDLEQFFQQYEADSAPQDETTSHLPQELRDRIGLVRGQQGPPMGGQYS